MIVFCYHNGALGHVTSALIECCTEEGGRDFPLFHSGKNLHHYVSEQKLFRIRHPHCNVAHERSLGNCVISTSSFSDMGRFLILLMALKKWNKNEPDYQRQVVYKQQGSDFGAQLEILSLTLMDKIKSDRDWFVDADHVLDVLDFWQNVPNVIDWLKVIGLSPIEKKVQDFCQHVVNANQVYYDTVGNCVKIANDTIDNKNYNIDLSFYQLAMCYAMLLSHYQKPHKDTKLLTEPPTSLDDLRSIFK